MLCVGRAQHRPEEGPFGICGQEARGEDPPEAAVGGRAAVGDRRLLLQPVPAEEAVGLEGAGALASARVLSSETDQIADRIGFRTIKTAGTDILLNDKPVFLRGICIHEENPMRGGRAYSVEDARMLLGWAKELNANFVRLAHYPHNEHMARVADELGLMVWEEIPVYWAIQWENADTLHLAQAQLTEF